MNTMNLCDYCIEVEEIEYVDLETYGNLCDKCCETLKLGEYENDE